MTEAGLAGGGPGFPPIRFKGRLRPSQAAAIEIARAQLAQGERRLHIVAPPGSGKTVLGLYLWAECVQRPAVVLSPNSAIQAQWAARTDLFEFDQEPHEHVSTDPRMPSLLTSLTYQSVTLPRRGGADLDALALELWVETLIQKDQAQDPAEALLWVEDLETHNEEYHAERMSAYRKKVRDEMALGGDALKMLHQSSIATLTRLRHKDLGLIILDECHHLMGHWGRVLADAHDFLDEPVIIGLTATPPDEKGKASEDVARYAEFFGPVDYEVPVPAVVRDGFLSTFQDLAYFVRPEAEELAFIANADDQMHAIVEDLCWEPETDAEGDSEGDESPTSENVETTLDEDVPERESLVQWVGRVLSERRLPTGCVKDWKAFSNRDREFSVMGPLFLLRRGIELPEGVPAPQMDLKPEEVPEIEYVIPVLQRYIRHRLRRSSQPEDQNKAETAIANLRMLGVQVTETGTQACASPVGRVMAYSKSKMQALVPILEVEQRVLGESIRAVVVTDYEKTSATSAELSHLLDAEAGGAVAAFKTLVSHEVTDRLDPVLVTGSSVLVDDDLCAAFLAACERWLAQEGHEVELSHLPAEGFSIVNGKGGDWCPRVYVQMITELFQQGLTRCLVGTRGLLGEGWDASKINVLVDLTTVTTSMSVNQLRGRSIRIDPDEPEKLADNWDVVCIAPEFSKGLDDYRRFKRKHSRTFGITDDGQIEKGVGHVHAAFTELKPEGLEGSVSALNADMLQRVTRRAKVRAAWRVGTPYGAKPVRTLEVKPLAGGAVGGFPPFAGRPEWTSQSLALAIGKAVLGALKEAELVKQQGDLHADERDGGYVRMFLEDAEVEEGTLFTESLHETFGPLHRPRYVIPREVKHYASTWMSRLLPDVIGRYFQKEQQEMAMLHAVPARLAKNKQLVQIFEKHWNRHVSPGEAVFAFAGRGEQMVEQAIQDGLVPGSELHEKEIYL